jgi:Zn finger protein HypA/HybF involved in hydrogenase expression
VHELSVALEVCRLAEKQVGREACGQVVTVAVDVGADAGVDPSNLEFCLEALLEEPPFAGADPVIRRCAGDVLRLSYLEVDDGCPDD